MARLRFHRRSNGGRTRVARSIDAAIPEQTWAWKASCSSHEKGAFTGAAARRIGQVRGGARRHPAARRGSARMDVPLQAKLLRAIQEKEIDRVGGSSDGQGGRAAAGDPRTAILRIGQAPATSERDLSLPPEQVNDGRVCRRGRAGRRPADIGARWPTISRALSNADAGTRGEIAGATHLEDGDGAPGRTTTWRGPKQCERAGEHAATGRSCCPTAARSEPGGSILPDPSPPHGPARRAGASQRSQHGPEQAADGAHRRQAAAGCQVVVNTAGGGPGCHRVAWSGGNRRRRWRRDLIRLVTLRPQRWANRTPTRRTFSLGGVESRFATLRIKPRSRYSDKGVTRSRWRASLEPSGVPERGDGDA